MLERILVSFLLLITLASRPVAAQDGSAPNVPEPARPDSIGAVLVPGGGPYFYKGRDYGTDAYAGPFDVLLNKGYPTAAWDGRSRDVFDYPYGWGSVWQSVSAPRAAIARYGGWSRFVRTQLFPMTGGLQNFKWYANYFGHLMEGGIVYRRLGEWYEAHGVPMPFLASALSTYSAALLNEAYEAPGEDLGKAATVADLLFFDPASLILFSVDGVASFFANTLRATVWPQQGSIRLDDAWIINNAEHLVFKLPLPWLDDTRLFYKTSLGIQVGLTQTLANGLDVTAAFGRDARRQFIDPLTGEETVDLELSAGLFVDRDNSLLWSVYWSETSDRALAVNIYPGIVSPGGISLGLWGVLERSGGLNLGVTGRRTLGLGVGKGF